MPYAHPKTSVIGHSRTLRFAATLALALPLAVGCSGTTEKTQSIGAIPNTSNRSATPQNTGSGPAAVPTSGLTKGMVLPIEAYEETYPQSEVLLQATFLLEGQCMKQFGFSFSPALDKSATPTNYDATNMARRYGLTDLTEAQTNGYNVPLTNPAAAGQPALPAAENLVLTGSATPGMPQATTTPSSYQGKSVPTGGCSGQAQRQIGIISSNQLADQLDAQSLTASQGNASVIAATAKWSACMKQHGFTVSSPYNASELSAQAGSAPGSALDKTIAVDDVNCKQSTNLVTTWFDVETKLQNQYISTKQLALNEQQTALQTAIKNAELIIAH